MTRTQNIVHAAGAVARELASLPLDTLPEICGLKIEEELTRPGVRVSAQLSTRMRRAPAGFDGPLFVPAPAAEILAEILAGILAWRAALPGSHLEATRFTSGGWQVSVRGVLAGFPIQVWDGINELPPAVDRRAGRAADPAAAAAVIVAAYEAAVDVEAVAAR